MSSNLSPEHAAADDFRASATAFSQLSGILGGFCFTILVLVLSPDFLKNNSTAKDWITGLLLLTALSYVVSSSFLANSMNSLFIKKAKHRRRVFDVGLILSNVAHVLLAFSLAVLVFQFSSIVAWVAAVAIALIVLLNAAFNFGAQFRMLISKHKLVK
ncbi:MAG: hypothetical protein ACM3JD_16980 [Rudaea sp.]